MQFMYIGTGTARSKFKENVKQIQVMECSKTLLKEENFITKHMHDNNGNGRETTAQTQ